MFLIDKPYVSDFLKQTLRNHNIPVVNTEAAQALNSDNRATWLSEQEAIEYAKNTQPLKVYTNSENTIGWIAKHLPQSALANTIDQFKDKLVFRQLTQPLFPDFYFKGVSLEELSSLSIDDIPTPFIIKPTAGFFSMGVYKVNHLNEWPSTVEAIHQELGEIRRLYPEEVLDTRTFIIEQCIEGDEFAIDAYYDENGEPVVLNILQHLFSSDADLSDRIYYTSKTIIQDNLETFTDFAKQIGQCIPAKNFPVHIELRRNVQGVLMPIEINPARFGGWCTTADLTWLGYQFNPYLYFYHGQKPDWDTLLKDKDGKLFSIIVLDNSTGMSAQSIAEFDYEKLLNGLETPLELRKIDYTQYPVFGFVFAETREDNIEELHRLLHSDLSEFVVPV